jgi:DNA-binding transcriptional MerR regulator
MMMSLFSTSTVAKLTGASVRMIDHWARTGLLKPTGQSASGRGSRRRYTFQDLVALQAICKLREGNCPLQKIRKAVAYLKQHYPDASNSEALARLTLLTDGTRIYMLQDEHQVMDVVTRQMVWSVPLGRLIIDTNRAVDTLPQEWVQEIRLDGKTFHLGILRDDSGGGFTGQCRELPGTLVRGMTAAEVTSAGKEAIDAVIKHQKRRHRIRVGDARAKAR